jgi:GT2 family glycosyltransferase/SAM-dependent methyltransferase
VSFQPFRRSRERDIQQAQIRAVVASPLFDPDWYLRQYPDVALAGEDPAHHYALHGAAECRSPGPDFDAEAYLTTYPDVAASGVNPLLHYIQWGQAEGRELYPRGQIRVVSESALFDADWYRQRYPDVAASGEDPARHYVLHGAAELRSPGPAFDAEAYVTAYPDVAASGVNPLLHYLQWGQAEGRDPQLEAQVRTVAASPLFDRDWYLQRYPDVASTGVDPARHYATRGGVERRSPGPNFDAETYLSLYADIAASGVNPLLHYVHWGQAEGRDLQLAARVRAVATSTLFDRDWYLRRYPDVGEAGLDPAWHYAVQGAAERRSPGPDFDAEGYLAAYPDVAADGANPLLHYLFWGMAEGRHPKPRVEQGERYQRWVRDYDTLTDADRVAIRAHIAAFARRPVISIVVPVYETKEDYLREMIESVFQQIYPYWELCIADDASTQPHVARVLEEFSHQDRRIKITYRSETGHISAASNSALELATGEFVALLDHDDVLAPHALYLIAHGINEHPQAGLFYSDEDKLDESGRRCEPYFKPDWNPELFCSQNFINHLGVYRTSQVRTLGGFRLGFEGSQDYDLALRMTAASDGPIVHIPHVLYHWRVFPEAGNFSSVQRETATTAARRAIIEHLASLGDTATVTDAAGGFHRVTHAEPGRWPSVSVIVPTRDQAGLLATCLDGLLEGTDYSDLDILVADNESCLPETLELLADLRRRGVTVVQSAGPFNFSRINNAAAREAAGEILLFLNNDVSVIHRSWLREMILQVSRPGVGAVGARLLYPDGTVQHGGVVMGMGGVGAAGHVHLGASRNDTGYFGRLTLAQDISCVTGACMAIRRSVFEEVGGFDEQHLAVAFNDVDLCIRIREAGYRIIWTPYAELYHLESRSRGSDLVPSQLARFLSEAAYIRERWPDHVANDPFYSPNLSLTSSQPTPAFPPRRANPWCQRGRTDPFARFSSLPDQEWLSILIRSVEEPVIDGIRMPSFPDEVTQKTIVGAVGAHTLREAFNFFSTVKKYCGRLDRPLDGQTRLLDFGCGWGRILRFFLKDCHPAHLWGIDVDPGLLTVCRGAMPLSNFTACNSLPPTAFADESFDVITAYSVFSHLAEHASLAWVKEFARVLKPGGIMVVTTEPREFIELCRSLRGQEHEFAWYRALAESFIDTDAAYRAYDAGQYLYAPTGGGPNRPSDFYGEALIPEGYVRSRWTPFLEFVDFVNDSSNLPQSLIVMRKK